MAPTFAQVERQPRTPARDDIAPKPAASAESRTVLATRPAGRPVPAKLQAPAGSFASFDEAETFLAATER